MIETESKRSRLSGGAADSVGRGSLRTKLVGAFAAVLLVTILLSAVALRAADHNAEAFRWVSHTHEVIGEIESIRGSLTRAQNAYRGYLLAGTENYLTSYFDAMRAFDDSLADTRTLTEDNPAQQQRWDALAAQVEDWRTDVLEPGIDLRGRVTRGDAELAAVQEYVRTAAGLQAFNDITAALDAGIGHERSLLAEREEAVADQRDRLRLILIGGTAIAVAIGAVVTWLLSRDIGSAMADLTRQARRIAGGELDARIASRRVDEIGQTANAFDDMADRFGVAMHQLEDAARGAGSRAPHRHDRRQRGRGDSGDRGGRHDHEGEPRRPDDVRAGRVVAGRPLLRRPAGGPDRPAEADVRRHPARAGLGARHAARDRGLPYRRRDLPAGGGRERDSGWGRAPLHRHHARYHPTPERRGAAPAPGPRGRAGREQHAGGARRRRRRDDPDRPGGHHPHPQPAVRRFLRGRGEPRQRHLDEPVRRAARPDLRRRRPVPPGALREHPGHRDADHGHLAAEMAGRAGPRALLDLREDRERRGARPALRLPRRHAPAGARPGEERVRLAGFPRAAHAADLDQGICRPAARRRGRRARARAAGVPRDRRQQRRAPRQPHQRPARHLPDRSRRIELDLAPVELGPLLERILTSFRPQLEDKRQQATVAIDPDLPAVQADADRLTQVFANLISNAHKYTPAGGRIAISARASERNVIVDITDSGIGMSEDELDRLFTRFFRAKNRTTQEVGGTGLGLSITRSLVELHQGTISVASTPGEGSTFTVSIPRAAESRATPDAAAGNGTSGGTILIVEDDTDIARLIQLYLKRAGYRAIVAPDANAGLRLAGEERPDLITLDVMLPDADGFTLLEWLKRDPETREIPVVMLSMLPDEGTGERLGAVDYVVKPIREQALVARIDEALHHRPSPTVLVADDDEDIRRLFARHLRSAGYEVVEATNGREALALLDRQAVDLVLLDVRMPEMDGIETLGALRERAATRSVPVIMITAGPELLGDEGTALDRLGIAALLSKSISPSEVARTIDRALAASTHPETP